jgi:geranylgeranyl pyrophosphate synthase
LGAGSGDVTGTDAGELTALIDDYLARPAGLVRPRILMAGAGVYGAGSHGGSRRNPEALLALAAATEILHVFALLHDDRIDADTPAGRGGSARGGPGEIGSPRPDHAAVLAGDLLHAVGTAEIAETVERFGLDPLIVSEVRHTAVRTILGQVSDIGFQAKKLDEGFEGLYRLYDAKTAWYTLAAPLRIGALAAGMGEDELEPLRRVALPLGRAFQLRDDLHDLLEVVNEERRVPPWELKLAAVWLRKQGVLSGDLGDGVGGVDLRHRLRELDVDGLRREVSRRREALIAEAEAALPELSLAAPKRWVLFVSLRRILQL